MRNFPMDGVDGRPGKDGRDGIDGKDGKDGVHGKDGSNGLNGERGEPGLSIKGDKGEPGLKGDTGPRGKDGASIVGPMGPEGTPGPMGPIGPIPDHEWDKSNGKIRLRFENPDGNWGEWVDLTPAKQIVYNTSLGGGGSSSGGGTSTSANMQWKATETAGNPGYARVGTDTGVPATTSTLYIAATSKNGFDISGFLAGLRPGDSVFLWARDSSQTWARFDVTGNPVDMVAWYEVPVSPTVLQGVEPNDYAEIFIQLYYSGSPSTPIDPPVVTIDEVAIDELTVTVDVSADTGTDDWQFDWGDSETDEYPMAVTEAEHTYATAGTYTLRVRAHGAGGWSEWVEDDVTVSGAPGVGVLEISATVTGAGVNLTAIGDIDWADFEGDGIPTNRKASGGSRIGTLTAFGDTSIVQAFEGIERTWTDGTPIGSGSSTDFVYAASIDATEGIESTNTGADATEVVLRIGMGSYNGHLYIDASLSDDSAPAIVGYDTGIVGTSSSETRGYVDIRFKAGSPGQTLTFRLWADGSTTPFSSTVAISYAALTV